MSNKKFFAALAACGVIAGLSAPFPHIAMWVGFTLAAYSVIANDSIQTIGTFLAANKNKPTWMLWAFVAGLAVLTSCYSWAHHAGDVTFERLSSKGFAVAPTSFSVLQVAAPLFLLLLTRYAIPVSTTFLILSAFAATPKAVYDIVQKSLSGYFLAFASSLAIWVIGNDLMARYKHQKPAAFWQPLQWITSGALWSIWIMQDAANVAVYLPRHLSLSELLAYLGAITVTLGFLMRWRGGKIQSVVEEKTEVTDVRQATLIDLVYGGVLYYFKVVSPIPMSTTWVFIGLLAGREVGIKLRKTQNKDWPATRKLIALDLFRVSVGLAVSVVLAVCINPVIRQAIFSALGA